MYVVSDFVPNYRTHQQYHVFVPHKCKTNFGKAEVITSKLLRRHHDLVDRYGISVSQINTDMFHLS
jgi:hypothetical protein